MIVRIWRFILISGRGDCVHDVVWWVEPEEGKWGEKARDGGRG